MPYPIDCAQDPSFVAHVLKPGHDGRAFMHQGPFAAGLVRLECAGHWLAPTDWVLVNLGEELAQIVSGGEFGPPVAGGNDVSDIASLLKASASRGGTVARLIEIMSLLAGAPIVVTGVVRIGLGPRSR